MNSAIYKLLSDPGSYPDFRGTVEVKETHISWVFLTERYAYKLKKSVRYDFLDFSTYTKRLHGCLEEVRLNGRMAPGVYQGVVFVVRDQTGALHLADDQDGIEAKMERMTEVEPLVKMRRLPAHLILDHLIRSDQLKAQQLQQLATFLSTFYSQKEPFGASADGYLAGIRQHILQNKAVLLSCCDANLHDQICSIHTAQLMFLHLDEELIKQRVSQGRIIEGHGDLRPEHICLLPDGPVVFDCIEFNQDFRILDVVDELAFLAVECEQLGDEECGNYLLHEYRRQSRDAFDLRLVEFYKSYRACVRAKVAALRLEQIGVDGRSEQTYLVQTYTKIAQRHSRRLEPRWLFMVGGGMGTGKTILANALAEKYGTFTLQTDALRRKVLGASDDQEPFGEGRYSSANRQAVYQELIKRLEVALGRGLLPVLDGSFLSQDVRARIAEVAAQHGARLQILWCQCPVGVAKQRVALRLAHGDDLSEARPELVELLLQEGTVPDIPQIVTIDTTKTVEDELEAVQTGLNQRLRWNAG